MVTIQLFGRLSCVPELYGADRMTSVLLLDPSGSEQHVRLQHRFAAAGWQVHVLPMDAGPSAALIIGTLAICGDGCGEGVVDWLRTRGYQIVCVPHFAGQRDCRWSHAGQHLWIGFGAGHTTRRGAEAVRDIVRPLGIQVHLLHVLNLPYLSQCLCPFGDRAMWHAGSFMPAGRTELQRTFRELVDVPMRFLYVCCSVPLNDRTLLVPKIADARPWLRSHVTGVRFEETNVNQLITDGGVSCLSLIIQSP